MKKFIHLYIILSEDSKSIHKNSSVYYSPQNNASGDEWPKPPSAEAPKIMQSKIKNNRKHGYYTKAKSSVT